MRDFAKLQKRIGVEFNNDQLLKQALVHRSYLNENPGFGLDHNERLEFLGDAVLELVVTENLYNNYPNPEGELTNWRASLVNSHMLAKIAGRLDLEKCLYLSKGESKDNNAKARNFILADAFEAVTGAIYLDQGYDVVKKFILENVLPELSDILANHLYLDPKSKFQEIAQEKMKVTPNYRVIDETGPDHDKKFKIGVYLDNDLIATGVGSSKQEAQINAAEKALKTKKW
ncbi:MAG: ribonuclease III [Candidatus Buchananbacteria bacterium]|nr:ribonuclease III [Candidatus Buchananbacteria bacterium]